MKFWCTSSPSSPQIPVVLRLINNSAWFVFSSAHTCPTEHRNTPMPAQTPGHKEFQHNSSSSTTPFTSKWRQNSIDISKTILIPNLVRLLFLTWHSTRQNQATGGSTEADGQFLPLTPRCAQDVPKSFTKGWERISLLWGWAHWQRHCVDVSASGEV